MKIKHEKIAQEQEIRQLNQHIAYLERTMGDKDKIVTEKHNEMQATKLELNKQLKSIQNFENKVNKNQSEFLDKDRMIMQLEKQLGTEKRNVDDLKKEMRDLKKYHYEELQKIENVHADKYRQLKQLVDQYRIQITSFEKS